MREPKFSAAYYTALEEATKHHASSKTYSGKFLRPHAVPIRDLIVEHGCGSVLDWGCGKGEQYRWKSHADECGVPAGKTLEEFWDRQVWKYDPAYPPYSLGPPGRFDIVLCTHVLGSIPILDFEAFVGWMYSHARKVVYVAEKIGPVSKKVFSKAEIMPRWKRDEWVAALQLVGMKHPHLKVWFATREKIGNGVITKAGWI